MDQADADLIKPLEYFVGNSWVNFLQFRHLFTFL